MQNNEIDLHELRVHNEQTDLLIEVSRIKTIRFQSGTGRILLAADEISPEQKKQLERLTTFQLRPGNSTADKKFPYLPVAVMGGLRMLGYGVISIVNMLKTTTTVMNNSVKSLTCAAQNNLQKNSLIRMKFEGPMVSFWGKKKEIDGDFVNGYTC